MTTRTSNLVQRSTSVVVVPNGSPLRCLRMDMAIELVSEVWVMVSHGLLHHHPHEAEGGRRARGPNFETLHKAPQSHPSGSTATRDDVGVQ